MQKQPNSHSVNRYQFIHEPPELGTNYYRIRQVDINGAVSYSDTRSLYFQAGELNPYISIYPNPTKDAIHIEFLEYTPLSRVELFTLMGKRVQTLENINNDQHIRMDLSGLPAGVYFLKAGTQTKRVIKADPGN